MARIKKWCDEEGRFLLPALMALLDAILVRLMFLLYAVGD